jgi:benzoate/toluate 1,2-dioxygenase beta subunit
MEDRVWRMQSGWQHSQDPLSRTQRLLSNVEIVDSTGDELIVAAGLALFEFRKGELRTYAGRCEYRLRSVGGQWKICFKKMNLINNDQPMENLTFIV